MPNFETLTTEIEWLKPKIERLSAQAKAKKAKDIKKKQNKSRLGYNKENRRPGVALKVKAKAQRRQAQLMINFGAQ